MDTLPECPVVLHPTYDKASAAYHLWWNDFATGFVRLISNYVNPDAMTEMGEFLFEKKLFSAVAYDVLIQQPSFIIIFWLGILISVLSLAAAIVFLFPCTRDWNTKKVSSKCMAVTGLVLSIVSLVFIAWGTAMYITSDLNQIIEGDQLSRMDDVKSNINTFMTTKDQNQCFANSIFNPIFDQNTRLPDDIITTFEVDTGLQQMAQVNFTGLSEALANPDDVQTILDGLNAAALLTDIAGNPDALKQVNAAIEAFTQISQALAGGLSDDILTYEGEIAGLQEKINTTVNKQSVKTTDSISGSISGISGLVKASIRGVSSAMDTTSTKIMQAATQIGFGLNSASAAVNSGWVFARWLLWVPLIFSVLAALVAVGFGSAFSCCMVHNSNKGISCFLTVLGIVMLALTSVVMVPVIVGMTFGYSTQTSFDPFFYDYNLKGLQSVTIKSMAFLPVFTVPSMKGDMVKTTFGEVMLTCKNENTPFFNAAVSKNSEVINTTMFDQAIDTATLSKDFGKGINDSHIMPITLDLQNSILKTFTLIKQDLDFSAVNPTEINDITKEIAAWKDSLEPYLDDWLDAYNATPYYRFKDLSNKEYIDSILGFMMDYFLARLHESMHDAGESIHRFLYVDGESCGNLYRSYADAGDLACKGVAGPVQGMWTAAGLAALFFVPLGLALLFISNAYRHGKHQIAPVHAVTPPPQTPAAPVPAPHHHHPVAVAAAAAGPPVVHHRVEAAPTVPLRHSSRDPWQSDYLGPLSYSPQPLQPLFVDPLASPPVPPRSTATGYRGGPANGYFPNPGSPSSRH